MLSDGGDIFLGSSRIDKKLDKILDKDEIEKIELYLNANKFNL